MRLIRVLDPRDGRARGPPPKVIVISAAYTAALGPIAFGAALRRVAAGPDQANVSLLVDVTA